MSVCLHILYQISGALCCTVHPYYFSVLGVLSGERPYKSNLSSTE